MRFPRIKLSDQSAVYHCMSRIVGGQSLLGPLEKEQLRKMIWKQAAFCGVEIITYCVLNNHFHILLRTPGPVALKDETILKRLKLFYGPRHELTRLIKDSIQTTGHIRQDLRDGLIGRMGDISPFMKELKQRFSRWYNASHQRYGTLWAERFKSVVVEDQPSHVGSVAAYIDLNPLRAGLVSDPKDYRFCGYAEALAGRKEAQEGIGSFHDQSTWRDVAAAYRQKLYLRGAQAVQAGKKELDREAIRAVISQGGLLSLPETFRLRMRYMSDGLALGSKDFVNEVYGRYRQRFGPKRIEGARPIPVGALKGLNTLRDLKVNPYD